jgi:outer membrane scaffolding protein for murein synthesis (MipA/OmpV family)
MGFGFSSTLFITSHVLLNLDAAINHLLGSAAESPITQRRTQHVFVLSVAYAWE